MYDDYRKKMGLDVDPKVKAHCERVSILCSHWNNSVQFRFVKLCIGVCFYYCCVFTCLWFKSGSDFGCPALLQLNRISNGGKLG